MTLVNSLPSKIASRKEEISRAKFFESRPEFGSTSNVDLFVSAMADNIGYNVSEDFVDAVEYIVSNKKAFDMAQKSALEKLSSNVN
ncbi:hypothetical protein, partial [Pseudomonas alvandae]|uniref:hypothetical protein n=1 Tax=Pseudomonas canavaninivorans TaxID=2842348 RepID=UPI002B1DD332